MARRRGLGTGQQFAQGALGGAQGGLQALFQQRMQQATQPPKTLFQPGGIEGQAPQMGIAELLKMLMQGGGR